MSMKIEGNSSSAFASTEKSSQVSGSNKTYSQEKVRSFEKYMQNDRDSDSRGEQNSQQPGKDEKGMSKNQPDLSSMLSSLNLNSQSQTGTAQSVSATASVTNPEELLNLSQTLTDKILVSTNRLDGAHQVMLNLNSEVLPNTSITLTRDINGMLFVNIVSSDPNVYKKLMETQDFLKDSLDQNEISNFRIEVSYDGAADDEYANLRRPIDRFNNLDDE